MVHCHDAMETFETFQALTQVVVLQWIWGLPTTKRTLTDFCFEGVDMINLKSILSSPDVFLQTPRTWTLFSFHQL